MPDVRPVEATDKELWAASCTTFLPESVVGVRDLFATPRTLLPAGRLPVSGGARKVEGLGAPEGAGVRGVKDVRLLVLFHH